MSYCIVPAQAKSATMSPDPPAIFPLRRVGEWLRFAPAAKPHLGAMKKTFFALAAIAVLPLSMVHAQTPFTATYTFGTNGNTNSFAYNGAPVANLSVGNLIKSDDITTAPSTGNFRATGWETGPARNTNDYIGFSVTADAGFTFSMTDFNFGIGRNGSGTTVWVWYGSTNNFASSFVLSNYTTVNAGLTQTNGVLTNPDANSSWTGNVLGLSSLTNLSTIEFRLYSYDAELPAGIAGLQGPFTFTGTINTPALSWYADGVNPGGTGTWSTTASNWFDSVSSNIVVWGSANKASFGGSGGTVTVAAGGITASNGLDFLAAYTLAGDALTLGSGGNAISVTSGVTTVISNELAGTVTGLTKSGAGTLVLAGSNSFSGGPVTVSAGTLSMTNDRALGNTNNDLVVNSTLRTTSTVSLSAARDISGAGNYDIATILTINGGISNTSTTLVNSGTLDLLGGVRGLGLLTINSPMILGAVGQISVSSLNTAGATNGTVDISPALAFTTTGDKSIVANTNVTVVLNGNVSGIPGHALVKTGAGQLALNGSNSILGVRVGVARVDPSPTNGGTVILNNANAAGTDQLQLNFGTLRTDVTNGVTLANGLSFGGRAGAVAVLGGTRNLTFTGTSVFNWAFGTSGEMHLNVDNQTTLSGPFAASGGPGSASGITIGGAGLLVLDGSAAALVEPLTLSNAVTVELNNVYGGTILVRSGATLTGEGTVNGGITVNGVIAPGSAAAGGNLTTLSTLVVSNGTAHLRLFASGINDQLSAVGGLFLGGSTLEVVTEGAYVPAIGDSFSLIGFGTIDTNSPPTVSLPLLATNRVWNTNRLITEGFLTVDDANPLPPNYANWLTNFPTLTPPDSDGVADPDVDGFDNFTEFAFGTDPLVQTAVLMTGRTAGTNAVFNWLQRKNPPGGATYIIKRTANLAEGPWVNAADLVVTNASNQGGILLPAEYERKEFTVSVSNRAFFYLEANVQP
jgi:autotransporter-associated beta strand protein